MIISNQQIFNLALLDFRYFLVPTDTNLQTIRCLSQCLQFRPSFVLACLMLYILASLVSPAN